MRAMMEKAKDSRKNGWTCTRMSNGKEIAGIEPVPEVLELLAAQHALQQRAVAVGDAVHELLAMRLA